MVTARMTAVGDTQTNVEIHTDLGLSGKIASFGRGAIEDVSKKILGQFTDNLRDKLKAGADEPAADAPAAEASTDSGAAAPADTPAPAAAAAAATAAPSGDGSASASASVPGIRKIDSPEAEAVDLLDVAGGTMAKRALPAAGVAAIVLAIIYWIIR